MSKYIVEIILACVAAMPGVLAYLTRNREISQRVQNVAKKTTLDEFGALYTEQRSQLKDCRDQCQAMREELRHAEEKVDELERKVNELEDRLERETRERIFYEEHFKRRQS